MGYLAAQCSCRCQSKRHTQRSRRRPMPMPPCPTERRSNPRPQYVPRRDPTDFPGGARCGSSFFFQSCNGGIGGPTPVQPPAKWGRAKHAARPRAPMRRGSGGEPQDSPPAASNYMGEWWNWVDTAASKAAGRSDRAGSTPASPTHFTEGAPGVLYRAPLRRDGSAGPGADGLNSHALRIFTYPIRRT